MRGGARVSTWAIGPLHQILTRATYKGEHRFNRKVWKTQEAKPEAEHVVVPVDPIIDGALFDAVQAMLKAKNAKAMPPRVVIGSDSFDRPCDLRHLWRRHHAAAGGEG
jgi:site-specific DNA recombinase